MLKSFRSSCKKSKEQCHKVDNSAYQSQTKEQTQHKSGLIVSEVKAPTKSFCGHIMKSRFTAIHSTNLYNCKIFTNNKHNKDNKRAFDEALHKEIYQSVTKNGEHKKSGATFLPFSKLFQDLEEYCIYHNESGNHALPMTLLSQNPSSARDLIKQHNKDANIYIYEWTGKKHIEIQIPMLQFAAFVWHFRSQCQYPYSCSLPNNNPRDFVELDNFSIYQNIKNLCRTQYHPLKNKIKEKDLMNAINAAFEDLYHNFQNILDINNNDWQPENGNFDRMCVSDYVSSNQGSNINSSTSRDCLSSNFAIVPKRLQSKALSKPEDHSGFKGQLSLQTDHCNQEPLQSMMQILNKAEDSIAKFKNNNAQTNMQDRHLKNDLNTRSCGGCAEKSLSSNQNFSYHPNNKSYMLRGNEFEPVSQSLDELGISNLESSPLNGSNCEYNLKSDFSLLPAMTSFSNRSWQTGHYNYNNPYPVHYKANYAAISCNPARTITEEPIYSVVCRSKVERK